jgi:hypothetical protein
MNRHFQSHEKLLSWGFGIALWVGLVTQSRAANIATGPSVYVWNFTLAFLNTAVPTSDSLTLSFGTDSLDVGEALQVHLFAGSHPTPLIDTRIATSFGSLNGFTWDFSPPTLGAKFDQPSGTMVFQLSGGSVKFQMLSIRVNRNNQHWAARLREPVTLIPEPATGMLFLSSAVFLLRRRTR